MFQKLLVISSIAFSIVAIGGTLVLSEAPGPSDDPEARRQALAWTTQALGSYQRTENGTVFFHNGISTHVAGVGAAPAQDRLLVVALAPVQTK